METMRSIRHPAVDNKVSESSVGVLVVGREEKIFGMAKQYTDTVS